MFCHVLIERSRILAWEKEGELRLFSHLKKKLISQRRSEESSKSSKKGMRGCGGLLLPLSTSGGQRALPHSVTGRFNAGLGQKQCNYTSSES